MHGNMNVKNVRAEYVYKEIYPVRLIYDTIVQDGYKLSEDFVTPGHQTDSV